MAIQLETLSEVCKSKQVTPIKAEGIRTAIQAFGLGELKLKHKKMGYEQSSGLLAICYNTDCFLFIR
jgi:hypothetical protein